RRLADAVSLFARLEPRPQADILLDHVEHPLTLRLEQLRRPIPLFRLRQRRQRGCNLHLDRVEHVLFETDQTVFKVIAELVRLNAGKPATAVGIGVELLMLVVRGESEDAGGAIVDFPVPLAESQAQVHVRVAVAEPQIEPAYLLEETATNEHTCRG